MSSHIELYEADDTQALQQVAEVTDGDVQAILETITDRLRHESLTLVEYIRDTLRSDDRATWMPSCTAADLGQELARWIAQACDDREGMLQAVQESR